MTTRKIYELSIKEGLKNDFRPKSVIDEHLAKARKAFKRLTKEKQPYFDQERLTNPYADSRIHLDFDRKSIKKALVGIDITSGDVMIAKELGADLVIAHHPVGRALQGLDDAMALQADVLEMYGVPINVAEGLLRKRISEVARGVHASNSYIAVDAARNLGLDFINIHTPADNSVATFVKNMIEKKAPRYVSGVLDLIYSIPEYQEAARRGSAPVLFSGSPENRAGKIAVTEMTGGTEGTPEIYERMANAGIGTIIAMHLSEQHRKKAEAAHINVVVAPHIASDSLGMNLILDHVEAAGVEIIPAGGFIRVGRGKSVKKEAKK